MPVKAADVIRQARTYIGTPFLHQGRAKGRALDCVGLVLSVAEDLKLSDKNGKPFNRFDHADYPPQPSGGLVFKTCVDRLLRGDIKNLKEGDILSLRVPIEPCHVAFLTFRSGVAYMIHAFNGGKNPKCVEHILDIQWRRRIVAVFRLPGVED